MRIAIVHDALCVSGGAERMVVWMARAFPDAPIFTSVYLREKTFVDFKGMDIRTLPFANLIKSERQFKLLFPLWYYLVQRPDFKEFDVLLSSSTYLAKYIRPALSVRHVCYLYAPFRLLWKPESYSAESLPTRGAATSLVKWLIPQLRRIDLKRTREIPKIATSCRNMAEEINRVYKIPAEVIYPPVEIPNEIPPAERDDYYLSVSRLISHKRVDLAVKVCTRLNKRLVVVGDGPEKERLAQLAGPTIRFAGRVSDDQLQHLYRGARGLIFPSYEDYGIVPLEAQAWGVPVIAFGRGGVLETIREGVSGIFFDRQDEESLAEAVNRFDSIHFQAAQIQQWASGFNVETFTSKLREFVLK